ncbi:MAG TPA: hypothetical protein VNE39_14475 [Planctomycetota bacterium]|nr:hypothetical protein [Planctomycetota bacterium]
MVRECALGLLVAGLVRVSTGAMMAPGVPETPEGLKGQMSAALAAAKAGDNEKLGQLVNGFILPEPEAWFKDVFGDETGARLAEEYVEVAKRFPPDATKFFGQMASKEGLEIVVAKLDKADDKEARGLQRSALGAMKKPVPLYDVRFVGKDVRQSVWSFVYHKAAFRFVGKMKRVEAD